VEKNLSIRKSGALDFCVSIGPFTGKLKELIHLFKYSGKDYLAPVLANLMAEQRSNLPFRIDALIAVPMPFPREFARGYNQSKLLADVLGREWNLPVVRGGIRRCWNRSQTNLSRMDRLHNAAKGFAVPRNKALGFQRILLIDDVLTTGATLEVCARLLKASGVKTVAALTLAFD
jgi:ComF family protein